MVKKAKTGHNSKHVTDIPNSRPADCITVAADTEEFLPTSAKADTQTASTSGIGESSAGQEGSRPVRIYADGMIEFDASRRLTAPIFGSENGSLVCLNQ